MAQTEEATPLPQSVPPTSPNLSNRSVSELLQLGTEKMGQRLYAEAAELFSQVVQKQATGTEAYLHRGICYMELWEFDKAVADFDTYIQQNPKRASGYIQRARIHAKRGQWDKVLSELTHAQACEPDTHDRNRIAFLQGQWEFEQKKYPEALARFSEVLSAPELQANLRQIALLCRCLTYLRWSETAPADEKTTLRQKAAHDLAEYRKGDPPNAVEFLVRASDLLQKQQFEVVVKETSDYLLGCFDKPLPFVLRAQAYLEWQPNQVEKATEDISQAVTKIGMP
jgi:tetratricopeptide (TPR) repeat protein